jgi:hypothetical protein
MRFHHHLVAAVTLSLALTGGCFAQSNLQNNKETQTQLKREEKVDKAQAKANKAQHKTLNANKQNKSNTPQNRAYARAYKKGVPKP